ncbi:MAG: 3-hydroxyacyl-CoA dehydrogenase [Sphingobium sp.]|nr:MAG: 3-hydroxyacyl-CoA dehydrogenase [Sphingobium sp.]
MATQTTPVQVEFEGEIAVVTIDYPPVNALSRAVRDGLGDALAQVTRGAARAVVLACAGRTFVAGADITEFGQPRGGVSLGELCEAIENYPVPVVAAIHGSALGGGLELALCAHHRIAAVSASCGLPEIKLGLIPGGGATQRLPRLVGVMQSLLLLTSGKPVKAPAALALGLVDEVVPEAELRSAAIAAARALAQGEARPRRTRDLPIVDADVVASEAFRRDNARKFRHNPAFGAVLDCVVAAIDGRSFADGLAFEDKRFHELLVSPDSLALRYLFKAERAAPKIAGLAPDTAVLPIARVGIVGAGTMGGGIAMACADAGLPVTIVDARQDGLDRGLATIAKNYGAALAKGRISKAEHDQRLAFITGSLDLADLAEADLVIEAVFEQFDVKQGVFTQLDAICKPGAILASNTSAIDLDKIAACTARPGSVIGLHFFSPANVMRLLEVVRGKATDDTVLATAMDFARLLRKVAVVAGVCPGFIANRMLKLRQNQSQLLLLEGAMPWEVDRVLEGFGFPMGPFAMSDLVGLDLGWTAEKSSGSSVREVLCESGRRGQKTGAGYYDYDDSRKRSPSSVTEELIRGFVARQGATRAEAISDEEILARSIYPVINEGAKILEEGIAQRGSDIDVAWVNGFAWPASKGGPMYYADQVGLPRIVAMLEEMSAQSTVVAPPVELLRRLAAEGGKLSAYERETAR